MTVISMRKDVDALTLTFVAEFDATPDQVWRMWEDARALEQWWGPPGWPATFEEHNFVMGGRSRYFMTGPQGEKARGWWEITAIDPPRRLDLRDGFADEAGDPVSTMATTLVTVALEPADGRTRMTIVNTFASAEHLEQMLGMGMEEGMREALGQIDGVLTR